MTALQALAAVLAMGSLAWVLAPLLPFRNQTKAGDALPATCSTCGSRLEPDAKYCSNCGRPLTAPLR